MGKYIKTAMDDRFINSLGIEVYKLDPTNQVLNTLMKYTKLRRWRIKENNKGLQKEKCLM
jgi:hypothetical protein